MTRLDIPYYYNVFLDNGTVALLRFLSRYRDDLPERLRDYTCELVSKDLFAIESPRLFELLVEVYYLMAKEKYDTYTYSQLKDPGNLYFVRDGDTLIAHPFPKMNTYGLTELFTNNAQGTTREESNTRKIADIEKTDPELAVRIRQIFEKEQVKLLSKVYFNEPYTKVTRLIPPEIAHFTVGKHICSLTGVKVKKAVDSVSTSAFLSGLNSFNSYLSHSDRKISWLAMYLSRFAPANCLYVYENELRERLMVYLFHANNLSDLNNLWNSERLALLDIDTLRQTKFKRNFEVHPMFAFRESDLQLTNHNLLAIAYTLQRRGLGRPTYREDDPLQTGEFREPNYSIMSIQADAFSSTMRPSRTDFIDNLAPLSELVRGVEDEAGIRWRNILESLKIIKPGLKNHKNANRLEREFRETVLGKIFKAMPIYPDMANFFLECYAYWLDGEKIFRRYSDLLNFVKFYENVRNMEERDNKIRSAAIGLGRDIGYRIMNWKKSESSKPDKKHNAIQGRKYILLLRKARTFEKFTEALTRLIDRFQFKASKTVLDELNENNYKEFRDFAIMSATNILISAQQSKDEENDQES